MAWNAWVAKTRHLAVTAPRFRSLRSRLTQQPPFPSSPIPIIIHRTGLLLRCGNVFGFAYDGPQTVTYAVSSPWFSGSADIATFTKEEVLATKLRALLQREKGRDLIDLSHAAEVFGDLDAARVVRCFGQYLEAREQKISRAQAEERMFNKLDDPAFLADVRPLLASEEAAKFDDKAAHAAFAEVFSTFIKRIPGKAWKRTPERAKEFGMPELAGD
jgi:Nucleotidyl transferase AbiEii toxin, Type IV TA system